MFRALRFAVLAALAFAVTLWISESRGDAAPGPAGTAQADSPPS